MLALPNGEVLFFTVRERARLQSFPDEFVFCDSWTESMRQIGNAVPVDLAELLARRLASMLDRGKAWILRPLRNRHHLRTQGAASRLVRRPSSQGLTAENLLLTPTSQGVYHLQNGNRLRQESRLRNCAFSCNTATIMGRQNIDVAEMTFACVTIHPNWTALAPERL